MKVLLPLLFAATVLAWGLPVAVGAIAGLVVGFYAGQYHRGWMHARGIRKSHFAAIRGGH